jgi:hypothetical protein
MSSYLEERLWHAYRKCSWGWALAVAIVSSAAGRTFVYDAACEGSYIKEGEQSEDLTTRQGKPLSCDYVILSLLANGNILFQLGEKRSNVTPLGFGGDGWDVEMSAKLLTMPLRRLYLPHASNPAKPQVLEGVSGVCFVEGEANLRTLREIACSAKFEIGTRKVIYHISLKILSVGDLAPGPW